MSEEVAHSLDALAEAAHEVKDAYSEAHRRRHPLTGTAPCHA
jgi:hypothetical protein